MTNTDSFKAPDKYFAIDIENKDGITVDGCGSTFVIHGDMCSFAMFNCSNIKLKNFTVKYNSPTNYEMKVVKKSKFIILNIKRAFQRDFISYLIN